MGFPIHLRLVAGSPCFAPNVFTKVFAVASLSLAMGCGSTEFSASGAARREDAPSNGQPAQPPRKGEEDAGNGAAKSKDQDAGAKVVASVITEPIKTEILTPAAGNAANSDPVNQAPANSKLVNSDPVKRDAAIAKVTGDLCADRSKALRVFILDLKSGWFAGDGGDTFRAFVSTSCAAKVEIVYAHVEKAKIEGNVFSFTDAGSLFQCGWAGTDLADSARFGFFSVVDVHERCSLGDLRGFQQVWVLSGSSADNSDVPLDSPFFKSVKERFGAFVAGGENRGVFLGAGLGNVTHANALASLASPALGAGSAADVGPFVRQWSEEGTLPMPDEHRAADARPLLPMNVSAVSAQPAAAITLSAGRFHSLHPLMQGLASLSDFSPDGVGMNGLCMGDWLSAPGLGVAQGLIALDACGKPVIAALEAAGRPRVVVDGNMARFYTTRPADWFNRIVNWLAAGSH